MKGKKVTNKYGEEATQIKVTKAQVEAASRAKLMGRRGRSRSFDRATVDKIRFRFVNEPGATAQSLAEEYEVAYPTMLNVIHGRGAYADTFNY